MLTVEERFRSAAYRARQKTSASSLAENPTKNEVTDRV